MGSLDPVLGPMLIGTFASVFAFGIMVVQCYLYFLWYKSDKFRVKLVVAFALLIDTVTVAFSIAGVYNYFVTNFDNLSGLTNVDIGLLPYPLFTGVTALLVQSFFGWRIQVLTGLRVISTSIYVASFIQFLLSIGTTIAADMVRELTKENKIKAISLVWLSVSLLTDLMITVTLVIWLRRNRTGFTDTDDLITRLIRLSVQTGLLSTSFAIAVIVTFLASPNTTVYIAFGLPLSKMYTNSLLSTLNVRRGWLPSGWSSADEQFTAATGNRSRGCHLCDGKDDLSGLTLTPPRGGLHQPRRIISLNDVSDIETQKSDNDSFTHDKVGVLAESATGHASD